MLAKATLQRLAQRSESSSESFASSRVAGYGVHSSSTIWMSEPSRHCTSIARSGESATVAPSIWDWKVTPLSSMRLSFASDMT